VKSQADADAVYATYRFFADDRRASKAVTHRGELDTTLYFLYDGPEVIEERDGSEAVVQQYVYGPRHIDDLAMIRGRNGTSFVHTDANWNVIGLTTPAGLLAEEYNYTPYGRMLARRHTGFGDADGDGDVDAADQTAWNATQGGGGVYNRNLDADYDGDNDFYDESAWLASYNAPGTSLIVPHRAWSPSGNPYGFTARRLDPESMLMHYRWRAYNPTLKRFMQRDPLEYVNGPNVYQYVVGNPLRYVDPHGLDFLDCMAACIEANDPIGSFLAKAASIELGWQSKTLAAKLADALGKHALAGKIRALKGGTKGLTTLLSVLSAHIRAGGRSTLRLLGRAMASVFGPLQVAYGLALVAVEVHCAGWCLGTDDYDPVEGKFDPWFIPDEIPLPDPGDDRPHPWHLPTHPWHFRHCP
jgi:RHS repeat-associated protein